MRHKLRIFLADDHTILREALAALIGAQADMEVVGQTGDGRAVLPQVLACQPDLVIMDISLPGMSGSQVTAQLRQACPQVQVVALTRHSEAGYVRHLIQSGAHGYVLKQAATDDLISAIRVVAAGGTYLDTRLTQRIVQKYAAGVSSALHETDLSEREADVVRLTAHGYSNKEIAGLLGISVKTVDTYKMRAMEKLGLHSRVALVRYALQRGWLDQT